MRIRNNLICLTLLILLVGCGAPKKVETTTVPAPAWVQNRPISSTYYVGIGSAVKSADMNQTQQTAKQNALADMASDISINISSNSLLSTFEINQSFTEDYTKTIKAQAEQDLEGYETVGNYEDQIPIGYTFDFQKLNIKSSKRNAKQKPLPKALDLYDKGLPENSGDVRMSFINFIKALEPLKPYFSEPLQATYQGKEIFLGNEIFKELTQVLSRIRIEATNKQVNVKQGQQIPLGSFEFKVTGANGQPLNGLTIVGAYTEKPLRYSRIQTDLNGLASFVVDAVRSNKTTQTLKATVNLETIANEATTDLTVRKLFTRLRAPEASILLNVLKPIFYINSNENNLDAKLIPLVLAESLKRQLLDAGFTTTDKESDADYIVNISASTKTKGESGTYKQTVLSGSISVKDKSNAEIYSKQLDGIIGTHFEYQTAGIEAYKEASKKVEFSIAREIIDGVTKGKSGY